LITLLPFPSLHFYGYTIHFIFHPAPLLTQQLSPLYSFFFKKIQKKEGKNPLAGDWSFSKNKNGRRPIRKLNLYQGEDTWPPPDYL